MIKKMEQLLAGNSENHLMPFFWQHGEDEKTLREYMKVIEESGCCAVCVESRPHPDFCGEKWWIDMDIILDEARKRDMRVWILDDSHFPTGFANGAVKDAATELHRQSICASRLAFHGDEQRIQLDVYESFPPKYQMSMIESFMLSSVLENAPHFDDDEVLSIVAVNHMTGAVQVLEVPAPGENLIWQKPEGDWIIWIIGLSRNFGPHRDYINMMDPASCRLLIDAVYEPHWERYKEDFGKTISGFFSDEPELGNGHLYDEESRLGKDQDLPFSRTLPEKLQERLGSDWPQKMYLLWDNEADDSEKAYVRHAYMDAVTKQVREAFSRQIGDWCHAHGVAYIGHMIEDGNAHGRTATSLGHYFRGLDGQDMSGIDDIGGQVLPQGEEEPQQGMLGPRDGEFYHYMLGALGASAAAIEPGKKGNAMCEIFGNYGWSEGVRLEKYLAEHFMVRGINHFVPHAFSPAPFPDPDCPPHFYAHGHNPQYRHFGELMRYMNRVTTLISGGHRRTAVAILYHAEAEWTGKSMLTQKPARKLTEAQIAFDCIPVDVFAEPEHYGTKIGSTLRVNTQEYRALVVPYAEYVTKEFAEAVKELQTAGCPVIFIDGLPQGICNAEEPLPPQFAKCQKVVLDELVSILQNLNLPKADFSPASSYLRSMCYQGDCELYYFVNEAAQTYRGTVTVPSKGKCYGYDAWKNECYRINAEECGQGTKFPVVLEPSKGMMILFDEADSTLLKEPLVCCGEKEELSVWKRSICEATAYPCFEGEKKVILPDRLAQEQPAFSGFVRYESSFRAEEGERIALEVTDACEGVEVFINGESAGIQIVPPYRYDIANLVKPGENQIVIEIATTLERACYDMLKDDPAMMMRGLTEPNCGSGITGKVILYKSHCL